MRRDHLVLYNPLATRYGRHRIPMSILQASLLTEGPTTIVDGNIEPRALQRILELTAPRGAGHVLGMTVMAGPQTTRAIRELAVLRSERPELRILWGGYFPSMHTDTVLRSGQVDAVVRGAGEATLRDLMAAYRADADVSAIDGISMLRDGEPVHNAERVPTHPDELPRLPYESLPMTQYLLRTHMGKRTAAYHSSIGCPFRCNFCGVVKVYKPRFLYESPERTAATLSFLKDRFGADAIEFFDVNFFHHRGRAVELSERIAPLGLSWWGEGRIDTLLNYRDEDLRTLRRSGLTMIYSGAEAADDAQLAALDKDLTADQAFAYVERMRHVGIVPELSFIMGAPPDPEADFHRTAAYIRALLAKNPDIEVIVYLYTPVPQIDDYVKGGLEGFAYPATLDEWATPRWEKFGTNKYPSTPWLSRSLFLRIKEFEAVLHARYPTKTDVAMTPLLRNALRTLGSWRYKLRFYTLPVEVVLLQKMVHYRRPETVGF